MDLDDPSTVAAKRWVSDGWAVAQELIPAADIDAAVAEVYRLVPTAEEYHKDPEVALRKYGRNTPDPDAGILPEGPDFRPEQFRWECLFPFPGSPALNRLCIHPNLIAFVRDCLGTADVRLYQAGLDVKYTGDAVYEQPLHLDINHSFLPHVTAREFRNLEGLLYLTDVGTANGATMLVRPNESAPLPDGGDSEPWPSPELAAKRKFFVPGPVFPAGRYAGLYEREEPAEGPRGSLLAYGPSAVHRASEVIQPGGGRVMLNVSFRAACQEWVGFHSWQGYSNGRPWKEFMVGRTPDELSVFGFPPPGHPVWDKDLVRLTGIRYPGLDMRPWEEALAL